MKRLLLILVVASNALAVQEYYRISKSPRALGMGGAFYGLSDDDYALFYNPAGLSTHRGKGRFNLLAINADLAPKTISAVKTLLDSSNKDIQQIADALAQYQGTPLYGGASVQLLSWLSKNFALGILVAEPKFNFAILGKDLDTSVDVTGIADGGLFVGYSKSFLEDKLHVGASVKGMARAGGRKTFTLADIASKENFDIEPDKLGGAGAGIDFDLGATYELPLPKWGPFLLYRASLVFNNLIASKFDLIHITGLQPPQLPRTLSIGTYTALHGWGPFDNFHLLLDFAEFSLGGQNDRHLGGRGGSFWKHVNLGVEAPMTGGWFTPRLGIHQGYFTAGVGFDFRVLKLDLATYAEELASGVGRLGSRRFAMRLQIGWGDAPPPPIDGTRPEEKEVSAPAEAKPETPPPAQPEPPAEGKKEEPKKEEPRQPQSEEMTPAPYLDSAPPPAAEPTPLPPDTTGSGVSQ